MYFEHCNSDALTKLTRNTLESIRRRVTPPSSLLYGDAVNQGKLDHRPAFRVQLVLTIPNVTMKPSLEDLQELLNKAVQYIIDVHKSIYKWGGQYEVPEVSMGGLQGVSMAQIPGTPTQLSAVSAVMQASHSVLPDSGQESFYHTVIRNKEVAKLKSLLSTTFSSAKILIERALEHFKEYQHLWVDEKEQSVKQFLESEPTLSDFEAKIREYEKIESTVKEGIDELAVGTIVFQAGIFMCCLCFDCPQLVIFCACIHFFSPENLKIAMAAEANAWKVLYGRNMNTKYLTLMEQIMEQIEDLSKRLSRPINDLDDVRQAMATLKEIREKEIYIDSCLGPVEVSTRE